LARSLTSRFFSGFSPGVFFSSSTFMGGLPEEETETDGGSEYCHGAIT
jgi:hypothetical protein